MLKFMVVFSLCYIVAYSDLNAQSVNSVPLSDLDAEYIMLTGTRRSFQANMHFTLDYGQTNTSIQVRGHEIKDESGETIFFNSMMAAVNYLHAFGFELISSDVAVNSGDQMFYYYVMRKRADYR